MSNLSEMFGGSAKGGNLSGLLPPRRPGADDAAPPEPPESDEVTDADEAPAAVKTPGTAPETTGATRPGRAESTATAPARARNMASAPPRPPASRPAARAGERTGKKAARRSRRAEEPAPPPGPDDTAQVSVYLLPEAKAVAKRMRVERGVLNAEIVFDAIDAMRGRLEELVRAMQYEPRGADSLFPARSTRRRARTRRQTGQPSRTLWTLQVTPAEHEVLDELVQATGANGMSQLIAAAVETYLLEDSEEQARRV